MPLVVLLGGARSGKSRLAVELASATGSPVTVVATGQARDAEMELRIAAHRRERPDAWELVEEPYALEEALAAVPPARAVLVDCLSLWTANALERGDAAAEVLAAAERTAAAAAARPGLAVAVTNEVGLGVVPATPLGRSYRDVLGGVNRCWAAAAASAALVVAGHVLELEGAHAWLASLGVEGSRR